MRILGAIYLFIGMIVSLVLAFIITEWIPKKIKEIRNR